jgi:hypothetical protein
MWIFADVPRFIPRVWCQRTGSQEIISLLDSLQPLRDWFNGEERSSAVPRPPVADLTTVPRRGSGNPTDVHWGRGSRRKEARG